MSIDILFNCSYYCGESVGNENESLSMIKNFFKLNFKVVEILLKLHQYGT